MKKKNIIINLLFFVVCIFVAGSFAIANISVANATSDYGGCMCVSTSGNLTLSNTTIKNYSATMDGGGLYVGTKGTLTLDNVNIMNCKAQRNANGLFVANGSTVEMTGGSISNNKKTSGSETGNGGGVYLDSNSTFTMNSGNIQNNAAKYGGGVYINSDSTFNMKGGQISNNISSSTTSGANIYNQGDFTVTGGQIGVSGNPQYLSNGNAGTVTLKDSAIVYDYIDNSGILNIYSGSCVANSIYLRGNGCYNIYCNTVSDLRSSFIKYIRAESIDLNTDFIVVHVNSGSSYDEDTVSGWVDSYVYLPDDTEFSVEFGYDYVSGGTYKFTITVKEKKVEPTTYPITLYYNPDDLSDTGTIYRAYGDAFDIPEPTRTGFDFYYWWTSSSGGTRIYDSDTFESDSPTELYAHWESIAYLIILDPDNGTGATYNFYYYYDKSNYMMTVPTMSGYEFDGWFTSSGTRMTERNGQVYHFLIQEELNSLSYGETLTLYGHWYSSSSMTYGRLTFGDILDLSQHYFLSNTYEAIKSLILKRKTISYWLASF